MMPLSHVPYKTRQDNAAVPKSELSGDSVEETHSLVWGVTEFGANAQLGIVLSLDCLNLRDPFAMAIFGHFSTEPGFNNLTHLRV
jgi:hypothetical protein